MSAIYAYATQYTRQMMDPDHKGSPTVSLKNRKPYRTVSTKSAAKDRAYKTQNGAYRSSEPTRLHTEACSAHKCICR